ncbi:SRPBCC domain-containing protein [Tenacibaculum ascidiaceicola]|uniref:SRPBCC family protein n=1 Tax=Tenacibaculum ascidiaceicola TaxID=1699411 RepID=UPI0039E99DB8
MKVTEEGFTVYHNFPINELSNKVYKAITNPDDLVYWWPLKCSGVPKLGAEYNFFFGEPYNWYGEVIKCEKNTSFYIKMTKSDEDWNPTTFGFDLFEKDEGVTWVHFFHKGWTEQSNHFKHSSYCWALLLNGLKNYVEKGIIIPFEERN